jgi:parallel beta-helix repeat protein
MQASARHAERRRVAPEGEHRTRLPPLFAPGRSGLECAALCLRGAGISLQLRRLKQMSIVVRALVAGMLVVGVTSPATALVYEVNGASLSCSDAGAGTALQPFCTIGKGAAAAVAGDTVNVAAATYREQVVLPASGAVSLPITFHGAPGARVLGTNNLSGAGLWTLESGSLTRYSTPFDPASATAQVFVDGVRLAGPTLNLTTLVANSFYFDNPNNRLYVDLGGDNPGNHVVEAGARSFGFYVDAKTDLVIEGFEVTGHNTNAIRVQNTSRVVIRSNRLLRSAGYVLGIQGSTTPTTTDNVEVTGNEVAEGLTSGIRLRYYVTQSLVRDNQVHHNGDHGIDASNTTNSRFTGNTLYANAKSGGFTTGMRLMGSSSDNWVDRNVAFENQDTGFQTSGSSHRNLFVRNLSFANQDHGFDIRQCDSPRLISNTAYGNLNDGFSIEDNVTNALLRNNIAAENGIFTGGNELWVDLTSTGGFSSDYDVLYRSSAPNTTIEYGGAAYASVADFRTATGNEVHGSGANPNFANVVADNYHPGSGPAIDSADASASGFELLDLDGLPPLDQSGVADTGAGVPSYADRGALEAVDAAPVARLTVSPKRTTRFVPVTANASASTDDLGIVSYRFEWGDGTSTTQPGPIATHAWSTTGSKKVRLVVTDSAGQTGSVQLTVSVR